MRLPIIQTGEARRKVTRFGKIHPVMKLEAIP